MDEFFGLLPVLLIYLLTALMGSKKQKKQKTRRQRPARTDARREQREPLRDMRDARMENDAEAAPKRMQQTTHEGDICQDMPLHLHEVTQQQFHAAAEGEDPCHAGEAVAAQDVSPYDMLEEERSALAQDVLRGVIMSEILMRPSERAAMQRNRRR